VETGLGSKFLRKKKEKRRKKQKNVPEFQEQTCRSTNKASKNNRDGEDQRKRPL
jgi:hypothetical protein